MPLDQSQVAKIDQPISSAQRIQPTHILQQKCLNKWVASAPRKATLQLSTPYTRPCPSNLLIYYIYSILCLSSTVHIVAFCQLVIKENGGGGGGSCFVDQARWCERESIVIPMWWLAYDRLFLSNNWASCWLFHLSRPSCSRVHGHACMTYNVTSLAAARLLCWQPRSRVDRFDQSITIISWR